MSVGRGGGMREAFQKRCGCFCCFFIFAFSAFWILLFLLFPFFNSFVDITSMRAHGRCVARRPLRRPLRRLLVLLFVASCMLGARLRLQPRRLPACRGGTIGVEPETSS